MKIKILIVISLFFFTSCKTSTQKAKEIEHEKLAVTENQDNERNINENPELIKMVPTDCEQYWNSRFPSDSLKAHYIDKILYENQVPENNRRFLNALKNEPPDNLAYENVLSPIFRLSEEEIGILAFPKYKSVDNRLIPISKEMDLIEKFDTIEGNTIEHFGKIRYYPTLLNSLFKGKPKPTVNYYTAKKSGSTQILELGVYVEECLEYFEYSIDTANISIKEKVLFSSPFVIDLVFENYPEVDLLLKADYKEECLDCPSSTKLQKSFAKIEGTENLYFVYADTFPINNELDTPSRALVLINEETNEIIYLWYNEIDLFGCSCL